MSAERHRQRLSVFLAAEWRQLVRAARSWLADTAELDAEDVVQDVALSLFEATELAGPIRDLSAYAYRALRNRVVDLYRRARRSSQPLPEELADERSEAAGVAAGRELREGLFAAIDRLPAPQREVFLATEMEGSSFRELAARWSVPIGTLLARKHRAVKSLRVALAHLRT